MSKGNEAARGGLNNTICASGLSVPQGKGKFFRCNFTVYGRYVYIRIPGTGKVLTLCEVEVYSRITSSKRVYINTINYMNTFSQGCNEGTYIYIYIYILSLTV